MIGGTLFTHNCLDLDYCVKEALASLQGACDEIVVVDAESDDGTADWLAQCAREDDRVRVFNEKWQPVTGVGGKWLGDLANAARKELRSPYHIGLQADEVLHEDDYPLIQRCARHGGFYRCRRLNFWDNAWKLVPHHRICGHNILRIGPSHVPFILDGENLDHTIVGPIQQSEVRIYHYGFIRKTDAQRRKGMAVEMAFVGAYNELYDRMTSEDRSPFVNDTFPERPIPYQGSHPAVALSWLQERERL